jgi:hypothetical protein
MEKKNARRWNQYYFHKSPGLEGYGGAMGSQSALEILRSLKSNGLWRVEIDKAAMALKEERNNGRELRATRGWIPCCTRGNRVR